MQSPILLPKKKKQRRRILFSALRKYLRSASSCDDLFLSADPDGISGSRVNKSPSAGKLFGVVIGIPAGSSGLGVQVVDALLSFMGMMHASFTNATFVASAVQRGQ